MVHRLDSLLVTTDSRNSDFRVLALISGRGSNLQALLRHQESFRIFKVLTDKPTAEGLRHAHASGVATTTLDPLQLGSKAAFHAALRQTCEEANPDLIVLAGFMRILRPELIEQFYGRIVNIHPSLLPAFPGLDTHRRALEAGVSTHGCSVHYVDSGVDTGPLIAQAACACLPGDTESKLAARVLELEHTLFPWAINAIAAGDISLLSDGTVALSDRIRRSAKELNFIITP